MKSEQNSNSEKEKETTTVYFPVEYRKKLKKKGAWNPSKLFRSKCEEVLEMDSIDPKYLDQSLIKRSIVANSLLAIAGLAVLIMGMFYLMAYNQSFATAISISVSTAAFGGLGTFVGVRNLIYASEVMR